MAVNATRRGVNRRIRQQYDPPPGSFLDTEVQRCITACKTGDTNFIPGQTFWRMMTKKHFVIEMMFNGVKLAITAQSKAADIIAQYKAEKNRQYEAYLKSPEAKRKAAEGEVRRVAKQAIADELMAALPGLDFADLEAVVNWLCDIQDPTDSYNVTVDKEAIVEALEAHGYVAGANVGDAFDEEDRENFARYRFCGQKAPLSQSRASSE